MAKVTPTQNRESSFISSSSDWGKGNTEEMYNKDHNASLVAELANLHKDSVLTDVALKGSSGDKTFSCHRIILAASSPYFRAMFTSGMSENRADEISLPEISDSSLSTLIDYIYTGKLHITRDTAQDLAEASGFLQLNDVQQECFDYLENRLDASNALNVELVGDRLFNRQLSSHARQYSADNFVELAASQEFYQYTKDEVANILARELRVDCEEQVYSALMGWVRRDVQDRASALPELLNNVAFEVIPTSYLADILGRETLLEDDPDCAETVARIRTIIMKRESQAQATEQPKLKTLHQPRNYSEVVILFRNTQLASSPILKEGVTDTPILKSSTIQYNPANHKWEDLPSIPLKLQYEFPTSSAVLHNEVIVVTNKCRTWLYKTHQKVWSLLNQKYTPRQDGRLVSTGSQVYLIGGSSPGQAAPVQTVLRFDNHIQQWKESTQVPIPLSHVSVVCCRGNIYALGSKSMSHFTSTMLCYNTKTRLWHQCKSAPVKLMRTDLVAINGFIFMIGQRNDFTLDVCRYDVNADSWDTMEDPLIARLNAATIVCNNQIYLIGGQSMKGDYVEEDEMTVETFDPHDGVWRIHSDMPIAVYGQPAVAILHPTHSPSRFLGPKQH